MKDLLAVRDGHYWKVFGNTFDSKELLKGAGATWNPQSKTWDFADETLPATVSRMVTILVDVANVEEIAQAIREAGSAVASLETGSSPAAIQTVEKVIEKTVLINHGMYNRRKMTTLKRTRARKTVHSRVEGDPKVTMVKPSYWPELIDYLQPGQCRPAIALVGPSGNGKTTTAKAAMEAMHIQYVEIDCTEFTEPADLIGGMLIKAENGGTSSLWVDGPITRAFKEGFGVVLNEYDALNPRAALCLQSVFQEAGREKQGRYVTTVGCPAHDRVFPQGDCPVILSLNTYGTGGSRQYVGRNTMDAAGIDRLTIVTTGYENEAAILRAHGYSTAIGEKLERWAGDVREVIEGNTLKVILSNRTLIRMAQAIELYGWNWRKTVEKEFLGRFEPSVRAALEHVAYKEPVIAKAVKKSSIFRPKSGRASESETVTVGDGADYQSVLDRFLMGDPAPVVRGRLSAPRSAAEPTPEPVGVTPPDDVDNIPF